MLHKSSALATRTRQLDSWNWEVYLPCLRHPNFIFSIKSGTCSDRSSTELNLLEGWVEHLAWNSVLSRVYIVCTLTMLQV